MCDTVFFLLDFHFIIPLLHVNAIYNMNSVNVYYCMDCYLNLIFPLYNVISVAICITTFTSNQQPSCVGL